MENYKKNYCIGFSIKTLWLTFSLPLLSIAHSKLPNWIDFEPKMAHFLSQWNTLPFYLLLQPKHVPRMIFQIQSPLDFSKWIFDGTSMQIHHWIEFLSIKKIFLKWIFIVYTVVFIYWYTRPATKCLGVPLVLTLR